ncbi:uncharacterized protein LOC135151510 [Daucus carota subsp. sativus]|uniref:uncharacterized protein LOC135151510 n=1 Tax=Daucus carota subsp. sativus TaxID=79200 RepID=UPI0030835859
MVEKWKNLEDCVWKRSLRTWDKNQLNEIFSLIQQISLEERQDSIKWSASPQSYSSKKGYSIIMGLDNSGVDEWRKIWNYRIPPKILIFLWKSFHGVLPLKKLLKERMTGVLDSSCSLCAKDDETREHLFWDCQTVKSIWSTFFDWWNISRSVTQRNGNFFQIIRLVKGTELKIAWSTSVIALLWTIWIARNKLVYRNTKWELDQVIWLVKIRAFKWLQAANKRNMGLENFWQVNPRGACLLFNKKHRRMDYIWCNSTVIGFSDGSWKITNGGSKRSGIGGCITDLEGNLLYIFSGPCLANSPLEAEREALLFLFQRIKDNSNLQGILTLCTDSKIVRNQ